MSQEAARVSPKGVVMEEPKQLTLKETIHMIITEADTLEDQEKAVMDLIKEQVVSAITVTWTEAWFDVSNDLNIKNRDIPKLQAKLLKELKIEG